MKYPEITISKHKHNGKWVIVVNGVTSGMVVHGGDGDTMSVSFKYDASRFNPVIPRR
jgi:hypothetical protein